MPRVLCCAIVLLGSLAIPASVRAEDAAEHLKNAKAWSEKREYDKAIAECDKAIDLDFNSAEAYNLRGRIRFEEGDFDKAIADYDDVLSINPKFAEAYSGRARAWLGKYNYDKALADSETALAIDPKSLETYIYRASAWLEKGDFEKARADSDRAVKLDPKSANAYYCRAQVYWRRGELEKAKLDFEQSLAIRPDDVDAINNLGVLFWKQSQTQDAKAAAAETSGDMETAKVCRQKSAALKSAAKAEWIHGITIKPQAWDIQANLGYAYADADDLDQAEFHLRKVVELKGLSPRAYNNLGRVLLRQHLQRQEAARDAEAKGKTDPAEAANVKQLRDAATAKFNAAIAQFERAVELDPALLEARLNLGEVHTQLGELEKAEAQYRAILKYRETVVESVKVPDTAANFSHAYFGLARIAIARNKSDETIQNLQEAIKLNPNHVLAHQFLAAQLYRRGDYSEGEKVLSSWLAKLPPAARSKTAEQFAKQLDDDGNHEAAEKARAAAKKLVESTLKQ